jgi:endonuclease/exonuclease/phosphatase family metal-dependent hydrolase
MRRSFVIVGVALGLLAAACGDDTDAKGSSADSGTAVVTYNAGLADGFVDAAVERVPAVVDGIDGLDAAVVFVQEVWTPADVTTLTDAVVDTYPHSQFLDPMPDVPGAEPAGPACPLDESQPLEDCARQRCADVPSDELADCVLQGCGVEFSATCPECQTCLAANVGSTIDEAIDTCSQGSAAYAYEGAFGIGFLSAEPFIDQDSLVLDSNLTRRAVLYAQVDDPTLGTLHVFGTHLSPVFSDVPFPGEGSWEDEQRAQIETVREWIESKTDGEGTIVLLGDFNTGPDGVLFEGEQVEHYEALTAGGWKNAYLEAQGDEAECTFCADNALVGGDGESGAVIDHVLVMGHDGGFDAERILDGAVDINVDGESVSTAYSDHYGVRAVLLP